MIRTAAFAAATLVALSLHAAGTSPARVDFTSLPEGASVTVDGELRGVTPLKAFDLELDRPHHVRFTMKDYEPADDFFTLGEGAYVTRHAELKPVKGLLLVTTDPAGAELSLDGYSLGETPRLLTTLDAKDVHRLLVRKTGYQDRKLEVRFNGRSPVVQHINMVLDSGVVTITSEPAGAEATLNGISRGPTPVTVSGIPKGRVSVTLKKDGYETAVREISVNAGDSQELFVSLEALPGKLVLTSVPDGARFYVNDEAQGKGPLDVPGLKPGSYRIRAEMDGYGPVERTVSVDKGQTVSEEFRLESVLGSLEVRTIPVGATVYVDGRNCGTTKSDNPTAEASDVLVVPNLKEGEHTLLVKCAGYAEVVKHPVVSVSKATQANLKLKRVFTPDVRIVTATGTIEGVMVSSDATAILVEVSMGITRSIPRDVIRSVEMIEPER